MNKNFIAALLLGIEGLLFFAFVMPKYREMRGSRLVLVERRTLLADTQAAQQSLMRLQKEYIANEAAVARILLAMPRRSQYDHLVESIQSAASSRGMRLSSVVLGDAQKKEQYQIIPLRIELTGNYPQLLLFLDDLEHSLRIYDIAKIDIAGSESSEAPGDSLTITLQVNTYSLQ